MKFSVEEFAILAENNSTEYLATSNDNHSLIFVQWTNDVGGLERITQSFERIFYSFNPLVAILRHNDKGLIYKNSFRFFFTVGLKLY